MIVSRDGDYGIRYDDQTIINDWLRCEFAERVGADRAIELTARLSSALKKLDVQVKREDIDEEDRIISESKLKAMPSYSPLQPSTLSSTAMTPEAWEFLERELESLKRESKKALPT
jgi:hypothetical protein